MKYRRILYLAALFLVCFTGIFCEKKSSEPEKPSGEPVYLNPKRPVEERVNDLLSRMNLLEKIGQMAQVDRGYLQSEADIATYGLGSILSGGGSAPSPNDPNVWANMVDQFQYWALQTRLRIPIIYGIDAVHGHNNVYGAVIFPHNIGMGCTGDPDLVEQAQRAVAEEVAGTGIRWTFAPCIAVPRDERWGRTYEGFGETPELSVLFGAASVRGFQGTNLADPVSILACAKHFVGDGGTTGGRDQGNTQVDEPTLRAIHLPGYQAAIQAGVGSIMASYSSWNGVKVHSSHYLLTEVLKNELGFQGFVVSDWGAVNQLPGDYATQLETAINAGIDMVMIPDRYREFVQTMENLVKSRRISQERIDDAVKRILRQKFLLGLFEHPFTNRQLTATIGSAEHRQIARRCVQKSLVVLKNEHNRLPLSKNMSRIHLSGKNADDLGNQCGGWTITWQGSSGDITIGTTVLEAVQQAVSPGTQVTYSLDGSGASGADVAIAVLGETPYAEGMGDRQDLTLDAQDQQVIQNLKQQGVPIVVVLITGRPLIITSVLDNVDALVVAWLPGTEGEGVTDVLFGDVPPYGRLSHSWPRSMSQIPINYGDVNYDPLFPYGYGLTW